MKNKAIDLSQLSEEDKKNIKRVQHLEVIKLIMLDCIDIYVREQRRMIKESGLNISKRHEKLMSNAISHLAVLTHENSKMFVGDISYMFANRAEEVQQIAERIIEDYVKYPNNTQPNE